MQLLDDHLWQMYDAGKITLEEMLDKGRQPGALQDKAMAKLKTLRTKQRKGEPEEDIGPILRT
jgi:Tfp pilus assembly ATPase PilU